ncbi:MAG: helix-turn-helix domain-containing protein [Anaerolineales bacterium]|nr:helix-turn-helix domain-containing protein [Anaerolineales bacterium]
MPVSSVTIALDRFTTFGDLLRYLRRCAGYTQRELSIAVGYSDTQISRLENNERMPDLATVTARFVPALHLEDQPVVAARLLELAEALRREDAPAAGLTPYTGLYYFDEADAELFFGREALTERLVARLSERTGSDQRFLAIVGASGSGKSSVVRAGLIPALRWQQDFSGWPIFVLTPTAHPLDSLVACLREEAGLHLSHRKFVDELACNPASLWQSLRSLTETAGAALALLVIDQFEELFTLCRSEEEQASFIENLVAAAYHPTGNAMIVIVLRADFYAHCARFDQLRNALSQHQEYIGPMSNPELRRAIEEPARLGHWEFDPGLVDILLHDVGAGTLNSAEPGALPLLSHALMATWNRRRGRRLTLSGYTASGGVRGAIAETAESVFYDQFDLEQRRIARQIFLRLTELGGEASAADTRRRVAYDELIQNPEEEDTVHEVLRTLADARLITTDQTAAEVAHEALIREWPTLRGWLEEDREGLRLHRHLTEAAKEWDSLARDPGSLYRGARLAQALEWASAHPGHLNPLEHAFLDASKALAESEVLEREAQRQREIETAYRLAEAEGLRADEQLRASRRLRQRAVFLALALVAAGLLAAVALLFWQRAILANRLALSRELAGAAINNLQVDPERSVLLALEALEDADTLEARNALRQALPELHLLYSVPGGGPGGLPDVAYSPDGATLATMEVNGQVKLRDAATGDLVLELPGEPDEIGASVAFSPDGRRLAASWATEVALWDLQSQEVEARFSGESVGTTYGYNLGVGQIGFSPDGSRLAAANLDGVSTVWDLATHDFVLTLAPDPGAQPAKAIAFSRDGRLLATGGDEGTVTVWDAITGDVKFMLPLGGIIHSVAFDPHADMLAASSEDGSIKAWVGSTGEQVVSLPRQSGTYDITFLAGNKFATAGQDGTARVWDALTGQPILTLAGPTSTVIGIAGSPDGSRIATAAYDSSLRVWDAAPGRELMTIPAHAGIVWNVAYSPDGKHLASASADGFVRIWDSATGEPALALSRGGAPTDGFTGLSFSPDGTRLATGSLDGAVAVWDSRSGNPQAILERHTSYVTGLAFSPDGARLASAGLDGLVKVWDLAEEAEVNTFRGEVVPAFVSNCAFSPDGKTVFAGVAEDRTVYQWDIETGDVVRAFSTEGREVYGLDVSPDGRLLAAGDQDGNLTLWRIESGEKLRTISGHAGLVLRLVFNQDGSLIASTSHDGSAKIWDVSTGEELATLFGNASNVFGASFSPDGRHVATAGADGTVRTFTLEIEDLVELARERLRRGLTEEECRKYLHIEACPESREIE